MILVYHFLKEKRLTYGVWGIQMFVQIYLKCQIFFLQLNFHFQCMESIIFKCYPPSSGIASCFGTASMVTCCLHLTRPCGASLGQVLIWVVSQDWFEELITQVCGSRDHINIKHAYSDIDSPSGIRSTGSRKWQLCLNIVVDLPPKTPQLDMLSI